MTMRWRNLLFAHWPVPPSEIAPLLPPGYAVDTYDGMAWVGIVSFLMERVHLRGFPRIPGAHTFGEMNVRTYVRDETSGDAGVYFFSLDASSALAVIGARAWYHLPYYFARIQIRLREDWIAYRTVRLLSSRRAALRAEYRGAGLSNALPQALPGSLEHFLTERYALFTSSRSCLIRAEIHHEPWVLEPAEANFEELSVAAAQQVSLPALPPVLHFSRVQDVFAWTPQPVKSADPR
jgi:uncharacterized protein